jgi:hypothetical protein
VVTGAGTVQEVKPNWVEVEFATAPAEELKAADLLVRPAVGGSANQYAGWRLGFEPLPATPDQTLQQRYAAFTLKDRKGDTWVYRGPHREQDRPALVMQFYYKTLPGFYFPGHAQPSVGTVTPYLRPRNPDGSFANEPIYGNANNDNQGDGNALGIRYRPAWPANAPVLQMAETLTLPKRGLPQVRGQSSALVFYQQSQLQPGAPGLSVRLHDPTREKIFELGAPDQTAVLGQIPGSVKTQTYQGKTYFPNRTSTRAGLIQLA